MCLSLSYHLIKTHRKMNIETTFVWERAESEEILLTIGGTHYPAAQDTEFDKWQGEQTILEWAQHGEKELSLWQFSPNDREAMRQRLISRAAFLQAKQKSSDKMRDLLGLPKKSFIE